MQKMGLMENKVFEKRKKKESLDEEGELIEIWQIGHREKRKRIHVLIKRIKKREGSLRVINWEKGWGGHEKR